MAEFDVIGYLLTFPIPLQQNVMAKDDGAIPGESESTDGLIEQYRRCAALVLVTTHGWRTNALLYCTILLAPVHVQHVP